MSIMLKLGIVLSIPEHGNAGIIMRRRRYKKNGKIIVYVPKGGTYDFRK